MTLLRLLPRFRKAYREMNVLAARERWSRGEVEAWQLERLNAVWKHAVAHVPHYRQLIARLNLPPRFIGTTHEYPRAAHAARMTSASNAVSPSATTSAAAGVGGRRINSAASCVWVWYVQPLAAA